MNTFKLLLFSGLVSLSVLGCNSQQTDTAAERTENSGEVVAEKSENAAENTGLAAENAGERAGDAAGNTAASGEDALNNAAEKVGEAFGEATQTASNAGVTAKIKNAITLSNVIDNDKSTIDVDTTDSQVVLKGHVMAQKEAQEAVKLAKANAGNRKVVNQLHVGSH